jgi:tartrate dehydrogenase/decarboxylase/D-malate dehydrogenase
MMLDNLGEAEAADHIEAAIANTLGAGEVRTRDMGGSNSTIEMGSAVVAAMRATA